MNQDELPEIKLDAANLYREDTFTDRQAGILRRMTPVNSDGSADDSRPTLFLGQTQLMTQMGALPVSFEMEVETLDEALEQFPEAAKKGIEETLEQLQEMRRESASSIITPGQSGGMGGTGGPGGGLQMP
ncbi:hypothetical protein [Thiohalomonas denitrificans]|uniref:Cytoplasmic protein n=1 Tax=Thiohalomonas denitrificans TaxID=415747 RepID=A0A1G5QQX7_9GAMM|nr:hypothetical protein [Thiohalomonas denitrificans]SCZ64157.1 hypothetical protein SAMN03097708_02575 [Thiohalomonas denitrificans]